MKRNLTFILFILSLLAVAEPTSAAESYQNEREHKLKAAFVLNFAKFTRWPEASMTNNHFVVCLLDSDPHHQAFTDFPSNSVHSMPIQLTEKSPDSDFAECNLIYISRFLNVDPEIFLENTNSKPILTVSDIPGFARLGGIIEFIQKENKLGFIINKSNAETFDLEINSALLHLASEVY